MLSLVEANFRIDDADRFEQVQRADARDLRRGHRLIEGDPDETLRRQVVNLRGPRGLQQTDAGRQVRQVILDQMQIRVIENPELLDPPEIDGTRAAVGAIHCIAFASRSSAR